MNEFPDRELTLIDILGGIASADLMAMFSEESLDSDELATVVLSSRASLWDKESKLLMISNLPECDEACRLKLRRHAGDIRAALSKLGATPNVVWFKRAQPGRPGYLSEQLLLTPDAVKPWETTENRDYCPVDLFEEEPSWVELWRMTPGEGGAYLPEYIYYLYGTRPIFFGKPYSDDWFAFPDHGLHFEHPAGSAASEWEEEYFSQKWCPSEPLPFEVGDIVAIDMRPFGPLRTGCLVGDESGRIGTGETMVLHRDAENDGWKLSSLRDIDCEKPRGCNESLFSRKPSVSVFSSIRAGATPISPEEDLMTDVRDYLLELQGFADRRSWRSECLQHDWECLFGAGNTISDEQLSSLLRNEDYIWKGESTVPLF